MIVAILIAFFLGIGSVHLWRVISFLSERGLGPDGPTADRRNALAAGWNGLGPLKGWRERQKAHNSITATYEMLNPPMPPAPPAGWPACEDKSR